MFFRIIILLTRNRQRQNSNNINRSANIFVERDI